jgi:hypothetical protein
MSSVQRQDPQILPLPGVTDPPGVRIDVELASGERLSLRLPHGHALGGGTCACVAPVARLMAGRDRLLRERVFGSVAEMMDCLFGAAGAEGAGESSEHAMVCDASREGVDYLGSYDSIPGYLRAMLEPEVTTACAWILDHLDYAAVLRRWECDGSRLVIERGHVYRIAALVGRR